MKTVPTADPQHSPHPRHHIGPDAQTARSMIEAVRTAPSEAERSAALEHAVVSHLPLATSLAKRYLNKGVDAEDLEQVAALALVKAISRYDVTAQTPFGAFATPTITGELRRHFRDHGWLVRPPRQLQEKRQELVHAREEVTRRLGRRPTPAELAAALQIDVETLRQVQVVEQNLRPASLDAPASTDAPARAERLPFGEPDDAEDLDTALVVRDAVRALPKDAQRLLHLRFTQGLTQLEVASQLGMTQMAVSRLQRRSLNALRQSLADLAPAPLPRTA